MDPTIDFLTRTGMVWWPTASCGTGRRAARLFRTILLPLAQYTIRTFPEDALGRIMQLRVCQVHCFNHWELSQTVAGLVLAL